MVPLHVPVFVLAPAGELPLEPDGWAALLNLQCRCVDAAERVRLFTLADGWPGSLDDLLQPGAAMMRPFCDALVPGWAVDSLSLGVYELMGTPAGPGGEDPTAGMQVEAIRCLDQVPLRDVQNEACWFYPTEDGSYLSSRGPRAVRFRPGYLPDRPPTTDPLDYHRSHLRLLWSLLADDAEMTCVGLTYNNRRIDWPLEREDPQPSCDWAWFTVNSAAECPYREIERRRVSEAQPR
ncbi:hypothetical protein KBY96_00060 [Cyanobium sp. ATX 6A2]|uniref:hypothetical protein n=1 Tax=Cyanobium sp. ATX 6A2 TaxID=2823700 RepID=UPI0020CD508C|nr:hypothetical protein [Cyanobium sp. ATX 6A2]MCP9886335.1 hypothetical protein [Cyanobium sp. ATX 6A2]